MRVHIRNHWLRSFLIALLVIAAGSCGSRPPLHITDWRGTVGNVLFTDQIGLNNTPPAQLWVGFDTVADFHVAVNNPPGLIVSGTVIADPTQPLGFILDPATTSTTGAVIPEQVQPMRNVADNLQSWTGIKVAFMVKTVQTSQ